MFDSYNKTQWVALGSCTLGESLPFTGFEGEGVNGVRENGGRRKTQLQVEAILFPPVLNNNIIVLNNTIYIYVSNSNTLDMRPTNINFPTLPTSNIQHQNL